MCWTRGSASERCAGKFLAPGALCLAPLLLAWVIPGCAPRVSVPVDPAAFADLAVAPASARGDSVRSLLATGKIEAELDGRRGNGRLRVIYLAPHRLRADIELSGVFGLFGARSVLWAGDEGLWWQEGAEPPHPEEADALFSPVLGYPAGVRDLEALIFGLPALWRRWPDEPEVREEDGGYALTARLADGSVETARVEGDPPVLRRLERRDPDGRVRMEARFDRHQMVAGMQVAGRIELKAPRDGNRLRIEWKSLEPGWAGAAAALAWPDLP
jgi:hypothetical protein